MYSTASYIHGPDRTLAKLDNLQKKSYYYLYNGHGDVIQIIDTDGSIVNTYDYDIWGNFLKKQETIHNPFTYFGQTYDETTGLYYLRARYYDPTTGRFTQQDPTEDGYNWYVQLTINNKQKIERYNMTDKIDKLNRSDFIKFIENLILNSQLYKRNNDCKSYVMALDSSWGTGKSYFIDLLMQDVENIEKIQIIKYNAWKNDYCDNAFNPLIYDILKADCLQYNMQNKMDKENVKNLLKNIFDVGAVFGKQLINDAIKNKTGIDVKDTINKAVDSGENIKNFMLREIPNIAELNLQREVFSKFKVYLEEVTKTMQDDDIRLVVIIDELDRCKPTFAVQTLEIVKHIFDVEGITFLFAIDIQQLSHSITSIYGQGFDSVGYLCRFFDYIAKMPVPDIKNYIEDQINEIEALQNIEIPSPKEMYKKCQLTEVLLDFTIEIYRGFDFSLRDFDTFFQSYKIMLTHFLGEYHMVGAHMIYMFYLALKYKKPNMFNNVFIDTSSYRTFIQEELHQFAKKIFSDNTWIFTSIKTMISDEILTQVLFLPECDAMGISRYQEYVQIEDVQNKEIDVFIRKNYNGRSIREREKIINYMDTSMNNIMFYPDLLKWQDIKHMTYREYIHKQLENYNFIDNGIIEEDM